MDEFEFVSLDTDSEDEVIFSQLVSESIYGSEIDAEEVGEIEKSSSLNSYNGKDGTLWNKHPSTKSSKTTSKKLINFRCGTSKQPEIKDESNEVRVDSIATIKAPPLNQNDPELWFRQIDFQFVPKKYKIYSCCVHHSASGSFVRTPHYPKTEL
ncbi:hypothetical protein BLOT_016764 [Blomia tropicalis]|nr:hypothetical protein BLOT_016764 [Blomia tropicalis]